MMHRLYEHLRLSEVARSAARTALLATVVVAALYTLTAAVTYLIVGMRLTATIDSRLTTALNGISRRYAFDHDIFVFAPSAFPGSTRAERLAPPIVVWDVRSGAVVQSSDTGVGLPSSDRGAAGPQTVTLGGDQLRVMGRTVGADRIVVGSSLNPVTQAQSNVLIAEALIAPALLLAVFVGAFAIGRRAAEPIESARRRQQELTADASHELRTPLAVIEAETSLALTGRRTAQWYRDAFGRVEEETRRMRGLVEDMLWLARIEGRPAAARDSDPVDLGVLAQQAVDRFRTVAELRRQHLALVASDEAAVAAPAEWLDRLLGVLLDNACRYTPEGGTVEVRSEDVGGRVRLRVDDSGPGIPEAERQRVFDRFHRASDNPGGAGLGLAIADAVVRSTGGRWELGSSRFGGASMGVVWPRA
jgi:signal transduction histidine kinase